MSDMEKLEARLDAALVRAKAARADGQRAENEALDLMIQIGTHSARKAEVERDAAVTRAMAAESSAEEWEAKYDEAQKTIARLEQELDEAKDDVTRLEDELDEARAELRG